MRWSGSRYEGIARARRPLFVRPFLGQLFQSVAIFSVRFRPETVIRTHPRPMNIGQLPPE